MWSVVVVGGQDERDRGDGVTVVDVHQPDAGGVAALRGDLAHVHPDRHPTAGHGDDVVVETDHERRDHHALAAGETDADDALPTAALNIEPVELGALAV